MKLTKFFFAMATLCASLFLVGCDEGIHSGRHQMRSGSAMGLCRAGNYGKAVGVKATLPNGTTKCARLVSAEWLNGGGDEISVRVRVVLDSTVYTIESSGESGKAVAYIYPDTTSLAVGVVTKMYTPYSPQVMKTGVTFAFRVLGLGKPEDDAGWCPPAPTK